jgi:hypothetical protein
MSLAARSASDENCALSRRLSLAPTSSSTTGSTSEGSYDGIVDGHFKSSKERLALFIVSIFGCLEYLINDHPLNRMLDIKVLQASPVLQRQSR